MLEDSAPGQFRPEVIAAVDGAPTRISEGSREVRAAKRARTEDSMSDSQHTDHDSPPRPTRRSHCDDSAEQPALGRNGDGSEILRYPTIHTLESREDYRGISERTSKLSTDRSVDRYPSIHTSES